MALTAKTKLLRWHVSYMPVCYNGTDLDNPTLGLRHLHAVYQQAGEAGTRRV